MAPLAFVASCGLTAHRSRGARDRNTYLKPYCNIWRKNRRMLVAIVMNHGNLDAISSTQFHRDWNFGHFFIYAKVPWSRRIFFLKRGYNRDNPFQAIKSV